MKCEVLIAVIIINKIKLQNPCHAELIKMPRPLLIVSQSDCLIQVVYINSHTD